MAIAGHKHVKGAESFPSPLQQVQAPASLPRAKLCPPTHRTLRYHLHQGRGQGPSVHALDTFPVALVAHGLPRKAQVEVDKRAD